MVKSSTRAIFDCGGIHLFEDLGEPPSFVGLHLVEPRAIHFPDLLQYRLECGIR